jgi:hypothetical protein
MSCGAVVTRAEQSCKAMESSVAPLEQMCGLLELMSNEREQIEFSMEHGVITWKHIDIAMECPGNAMIVR